MQNMYSQPMGFTHVVRAGLTVRRPVRSFTATIQNYLTLLRSSGVRFVPEPLGYDEQGREAFEFIEGELADDELPDWAARDEVLKQLGRLIRQTCDGSSRIFR